MAFDAPLPATPSLAALAYALRHPETWPPNFEWNYSYCHSCAIGLTAELWNLSQQDLDAFEGPLSIAGVMKMPRAQAAAIFWFLDHDTRRITPNHVADAIDQYLANGMGPASARGRQFVGWQHPGIPASEQLS